MIYLGVDPGASGAICVLDPGAEINFVRLSETEADVVDWLATYLNRHEVRFAMVENVHAMPKQGVASTFKFGRSYGFLRGVLAAFDVPREFVAPRVWQKAMGCLSRGDKNVTKAKAQELFPALKIAHWNADALLLAEYCRRTI